MTWYEAVFLVTLIVAAAFFVGYFLTAGVWLRIRHEKQKDEIQRDKFITNPEMYDPENPYGTKPHFRKVK